MSLSDFFKGIRHLGWTSRPAKEGELEAIHESMRKIKEKKELLKQRKEEIDKAALNVAGDSLMNNLF